MAVLIVTHDWGVVADICDRVVVMYAGQVVERAAQLTEMFRTPLHPYSKALLASNPHHAPDTDRLPTIPGTVPQPGPGRPAVAFTPVAPTPRLRVPRLRSLSTSRSPDAKPGASTTTCWPPNE